MYLSQLSCFYLKLDLTLGVNLYFRQQMKALDSFQH